ncbi:MAG: WG repeat-containing protein [Bacteroidota bacterium]
MMPRPTDFPRLAVIILAACALPLHAQERPTAWAIPPTYTHVGFLEDHNLFQTEIRQRDVVYGMGLVTPSGTVLVDAQDELSIEAVHTEDDFVRVQEQGGRYMLVRRDGSRIAAPTRFGGIGSLDISPFSAQRALIRLGTSPCCGYAYVDTLGYIAIPKQPEPTHIDSIGPSNSLLFVDHAEPFSESIAYVNHTSGPDSTHVSVVYAQGGRIATALPPGMMAMGPMQEGRMPARMETAAGPRWGFLQTQEEATGALVEFDDALKDVRDYLRGLARARGEELEPWPTHIGVAVPFEYDSVEPFSGGLAKVEQNGRYGLVGRRGTVLFPVAYDDIDEFSEGVARVEQEGKYGLISLRGNVVLPIEYDNIGELSKGSARVKQGDAIGFVDRSGTLTADLDPKLFKSSLFADENSGKLFATCLGFNQCGVIDITGEVVIPHRYHFGFSRFVRGVTTMKSYSPDFSEQPFSGLITDEGVELVPPQYIYANIIAQHADYVAFMFDPGDAYYNVYNLTEALLVILTDDATLSIPYTPFGDGYSRELHEDNGRFFVEVYSTDGEEWWLYDEEGNGLVRQQKGRLLELVDGLIKVEDGNDRLGFMNVEGQWVVKPQYEEATSFYDGYALLTRERRRRVETYIVDTQGNLEKTPWRVWETADLGGYYVGRHEEDGRFALITHDGRPVMALPGDVNPSDTRAAGRGLFWVRDSVQVGDSREERYGLIRVP